MARATYQPYDRVRLIAGKVFCREDILSRVLVYLRTSYAGFLIFRARRPFNLYHISLLNSELADPLLESTAGWVTCLFAHRQQTFFRGFITFSGRIFSS